MKLLICLVTYNRLDYTKRTLQSMRHALGENLDYYLVVVDNASADGTQEYVKKLERRKIANAYILNGENYYPGKACNMGWERGLKFYEPTHLMRLDNDMHFEKGWFERVEDYFNAIPELGQLGLDHEAIEHPSAELRKRTINGMTINEWPGCVGGPSIITKKIWDLGIRWPELRWNDERNSAAQEDSAFSREIQNAGYLVGHTQEELARTFANKTNWQDYPEYYLKTMTDRGYDDNVKLIKELK